MGLPWAITTTNKLRSTWTSSIVTDASSEAVGYPKENAIDGNKESAWKGSSSSDYIIIDTGDDSISYDYIMCIFDPLLLPTELLIQTSSNGTTWSDITNQYDGSVTTELINDCSGASRIISVDDATDFKAGNTVELLHGSYSEWFLVISTGTGYLELDRYVSSTFETGDTVSVLPGANSLAMMMSGEDKRYIKLTVTGNPHILEAVAFSVNWVFDNSDLPYNPSALDEIKSVGGITRSFSGYGIGKISTMPSYSKLNISIHKITDSGLNILYSCVRNGAFGILMDDCRWFEGMISGDMTTSRRASNSGSLISYSTSFTFEEI